MKTVKQHNRRKQRTTKVTEVESKPNKKINLSYVQGATEQLRRTFNKYNIKTLYYTPATLRSLMSKPKSKERQTILFINWTVRIVKLFMLEKQKEPSISEPMSTSQPSNQLTKEATLQNTIGNTTVTLIGITRKCWILKRIGKPRQ